VKLELASCDAPDLSLAKVPQGQPTIKTVPTGIVKQISREESFLG
jgi:hypothetical protein